MIKILSLFLTLFVSNMALALEYIPYNAEKEQELIKSGEVYYLHFYADWCPTCRGQIAIFDKFKNDSAVNKELTGVILAVNYDTAVELKKKHKIFTQTILVSLQGEKEIYRSVNQTDPFKLKVQLGTR